MLKNQDAPAQRLSGIWILLSAHDKKSHQKTRLLMCKCTYTHSASGHKEVSVWTHNFPTGVLQLHIKTEWHVLVAQLFHITPHTQDRVLLSPAKVFCCMFILLRNCNKIIFEMVRASPPGSRVNNRNYWSRHKTGKLTVFSFILYQTV